jgi:ribonuclease J
MTTIQPEYQSNQAPASASGPFVRSLDVSTTLRIVPLGGLGEIGKNMMAIEYGQEILIVDVGVMFPENDMWGIDLVIPDWSYLRDKFDRVVGIVITHGHEDHIGALPYLLKEVQAPVYATRLAFGLIEGKLKRQDLAGTVELPVLAVRPGHTVQVGDQITIGAFQIEFLAMNHPSRTASRWRSARRRAC